MAQSRNDRWMIKRIEDACIKKGLIRVNFIESLKRNETFAQYFALSFMFPVLFIPGALFVVTAPLWVKLVVGLLCVLVFHGAFR